MELTPRGRTQHSPLTLSFDRDADSVLEQDREILFKWAAIEKLPTFKRIRTSFIDVIEDEGVQTSSSSASNIDLKSESRRQLRSDSKRVVDVTKLGAFDRRLLIDKLIKHIENDNLQLLQKLRERIERCIQFNYKNVHPEFELILC